MRPRHKAAENVVQQADGDDTAGLASMRPRHKAAENPPVAGTPEPPSPRFNEAAA